MCLINKTSSKHVCLRMMKCLYRPISDKYAALLLSFPSRLISLTSICSSVLPTASSAAEQHRQSSHDVTESWRSSKNIYYEIKHTRVFELVCEWVSWLVRMFLFSIQDGHEQQCENFMPYNTEINIVLPIFKLCMLKWSDKNRLQWIQWQISEFVFFLPVNFEELLVLFVSRKAHQFTIQPAYETKIFKWRDLFWNINYI